MFEPVTTEESPAFSDAPACLLDAECGSADIFPGVLSVYQEQGYHAGYRRAVADTLASVLLLTHEFLREQPAGPADARELLCRFSRHLERHLPTTRDEGYLNGGLGI